MDPWLRDLVYFFVAFLAFSLMLIVGAIVRESTVAPGEKDPQPSNRRRSRIVMAIALIMAVVILYQGRASWNVEGGNPVRAQRRPPQATSELKPES